MSSLYVTDNDVKIGIVGGRFVVSRFGETISSLPRQSVTDITIMGMAQVSTQSIDWCVDNGVPISFMGPGAHYYGVLRSPMHPTVNRQRKQCELYNSKFALEVGRKMLAAKVHNELVVLRRYERTTGIYMYRINKMLQLCEKGIMKAVSINEMMGYEGTAAKMYFKGLAAVVDDEFRFNGRSHHPARDEFNVMLNIGYTILHNILYNEIEKKGLNPYFGFVHRDNNSNQTLASDLMEEWRPIIIDSTVMSIVNGHEISKNHFYTEEGVISISKDGYRIFINKIFSKMKNKSGYNGQERNYFDSIANQVSSLVKAIEAADYSLMENMRIR